MCDLEPLVLHESRRYLWRVGVVSGCERCGLVFANPLPTARELALVTVENAAGENELHFDSLTLEQ